MDSRSDFIKGFGQWIALMDDAYLIGITNKGIFNRAVKDLEAAPQVAVEAGEESVRCTLADGNTCTLVADIQKYTCTCPARTVCKHVVIALLYLRANPETYLGEAVEELQVEHEKEHAEPKEFLELLGLTPDKLCKMIGEKAYGDVVFRLNFGVDTAIEEGVMLTIHFTEEDRVVRFPWIEPLRDAICSCKSKELCKHKAEAILCYQLAKGKIQIEELQVPRNTVIPQDTLAKIVKYISELLVLGLSRLPATSTEQMEQWAIICHNSNLVTLERLFRRLKHEAELYFAKDVRFSKPAMLGGMTKIWSICRALQGETGNPETLEKLMGEHKSAYHDVPPVELLGMGARSWTSKAGFEGITFYFYNPRLGTWLTYTNSRPTYYEDMKTNRNRMYKGNPPWGLEGRLDHFSKSKIKLIHGKMNEEGRISSSGETQARILGKTDVLDPCFNPWTQTCWDQVFKIIENQMVFTLADKGENSTLMLLKPAQWGQSHFDKITQQFTLVLYDSEGTPLEISVQYTEGNKSLIEKLESLERKQALPSMILGTVFIQNQVLTVLPIVGYSPTGAITNLTLD